MDAMPLEHPLRIVLARPSSPSMGKFRFQPLELPALVLQALWKNSWHCEFRISNSTHLSTPTAPMVHSPYSASFAVLPPMMLGALQQPPAFLLLDQDLSMACIVHLTVGNAQPHDSPFLGRTLVVRNRRPFLSCSSAFQDIPAPHED